MECTLRAFLGLADYYQRFIHDYAAITTPLTNLLRTDVFRWSLEVETSFCAL
jgi:hypothetical protein